MDKINRNKQKLLSAKRPEELSGAGEQIKITMENIFDMSKSFTELKDKISEAEKKRIPHIEVQKVVVGETLESARSRLSIMDEGITTLVESLVEIEQKALKRKVGVNEKKEIVKNTREEILQKSEQEYFEKLGKSKPENPGHSM